MGNAAVVAGSVKSQADSGAKKLYQLVDLKGGGELIECMKKARRMKNYDEIDRRIKNDVKSFLYNGGEGKKVPIIDLIKFRNRDVGHKIKIGKDKHEKAKELAMIDMKFTDEEGNYLHSRPDRKYRDVCWDIEQRGAVGETILHMCVLNYSSIHADLAKRLLQFFPKLINDVYLGDEYYGELVLHIAIVNEDPAMVKFLLDHGCDVNYRCCGNFFCPTDQKSSRTDNLDHEWVDVCQETNYEGHVYFGEYPLSFAACLGQEECVRLLLAKGADPNAQDANGNTVMHMLVIHDKKEMFDLLHDLGAKIDIKNRQGLTPLTLAAKLARKEMYDHILEIERSICWIYGNVTCAGYPLRYIDTISPTGEINQDSALNLLVYGEEEGHLDMMDGLIVNLLDEKWKTFVRFRFYRRFFFFSLYFVLFVIAFALRPGTDAEKVVETYNVSGTNTTKNRTVINPCYLQMPYSTSDYVRFVLETIILLSSMFYLFLAMKEIYHQGFKIFFCTLKGAPAKALFLLSCIFVVCMLPGRAVCAYEYEDVVGVLAILTTAPYFLFFCRGFKIVGPFVIMVYKMIMGDLLRFFIIYSVFIIGFSQAMFIIFKNKDDTSFSYPAEAVMAMFMMSLGEFGDFYENFDQTYYPELAKFVFVLYMIMVTLLLVNMLIAMMGNTYQLISSTQKEWFRQWAKIVLVIEQSVTTEERSKQQQKYSQPTPDGQRALVIRWHQSEREKEELRKIRQENKEQQQLLLQKKHSIQIRKPQLPTTLSVKEAVTGKCNI